jgi:hypothetical protein
VGVANDLKDRTDGFSWSLVKTREQKAIEQTTTTPIQQFETGFLGASNDALGDYFNSRLPDIRGRKEYFNQDSFVVIDERSARDDTVLVVIWWVEVPKEDLIAFGDDEVTLKGWLPTGWHSIRIRLADAVFVCNGIQFTDDYYLIQRSGPECFTKDGVLIVEY